MMKKLRGSCRLLVLLLIFCCLCACENRTQPAAESGGTADSGAVSRDIFAMDTYMTVTAYGERAKEAADAAEAEIRRLEALLSVGDSGSEVYQINHNGSGRLSEDTAALFKVSGQVYNDTDGAYDITVYPLMKLWGFTGDVQAVPSAEDIAAAVADSGFSKLTYVDGILTLGKNQGIDFGAIAKGYTGDRIMDIFRQYGVESGIVSLGGNVQCHGTKPDGSLWRCGITDPENPEDTSSLLGIVSVRDKAVITSGGYERYFVDDATGAAYHHIMNPHTGYPADSGLVSVTIISSDGTLADALSTACFVMGEENALAYWRANSSRFDMVLMNEDGEIVITEGIEDSFSSGREFRVEKE